MLLWAMVVILRLCWNSFSWQGHLYATDVDHIESAKTTERLAKDANVKEGLLFYSLISILTPDLNSTVKWSSKTVIFFLVYG
jgi:hypothetical protein